MSFLHFLPCVALTLLTVSQPLFAQSINSLPDNRSVLQPSADSLSVHQPIPAVENIVSYSVNQKLRYELTQSFGLHGLLGSALTAGVYQKTNTPSEWGGGLSGYGRRYASFLGTSGTRGVFAFALESSLHQDPRYFPSLQHGFRARFGSAIKQAFVVHTDAGAQQFAYARIFSAFGAAYMTNTWNPASNRSAWDGTHRAGFIIASDVGWNLIQEFVRFTRPKDLRHRQP
jgi:hypothetical protein